MKFSLKVVSAIVFFVAVVVAASSPFLRMANERSVRMHEVRHNLDYVAIRASARELLALAGTTSVVLKSGDAEIPDAIASTSPVSAELNAGQLTIEYGDGHEHFGLIIVPEGIQPSAGEPIISGVNYYQRE